MDAELIQRMLDGENEATLAVRNHLRTVANRVLAAPQWGQAEGPDLTRMEQESAAEGLAHRPATPVSLAVAAMGAASRLSLAKLRVREGMNSTEHPDTRLIVALALQTASAAQANNLRTHMEHCAACKRHVELTQHAIRSAASATTAAEQITATERTGGALERAVQDALGAEEEPATPARPARPRPPRQPKAKADLSAGIPLVLVLCAMAYFSWRYNQLSPQEATWAVAELLPPELPPSARAESYGGVAREGILELRKGDCRSAANRLRSAVKHAPEDLYLRYYEGLAYVCMREGPAAVEALEDVKANADISPFGLEWWLGQAQLLNGQIDDGLSTLDRLAATTHPRSAQARTLADAVRETLK